MEKETKKTTEAQNETQAQTAPKKTNKSWEAFQRLKGSLIVNDPAFLL